MDAYTNQQIFLTNEKNKSQIISLLQNYLESDGQIVRCSTRDADTMIAHCALEFEGQRYEVIVAAHDTDVLVLLMYYWKKNMADTYFLSEARKTVKIWKIDDLIEKAGPIITSHLLSIQAWSGSLKHSGRESQFIEQDKQSEEMQKISHIIISLYVAFLCHFTRCRRAPPSSI